MGQTLDNGIYLPSEGERNCYEGLAGNWVALDNHLGSTNIHVTINDKQAWDGHVADTTIHVTSADKQTWNSHVADTTIHVTSADKQAWDGHVADSVKHVTAEDKAKWDAVTSKANDSDVVHTSGNETIAGNKTFSSINGVQPSSLSLPNFSNRIDISSYVTNLNGTYNAYTPSVDGWIAIQSNNATFIRIADTGSGGLGNTVTSQTAGTLTCMLPVRANRQNNIYIVCATLTSAYFIPCLGKV